MNRIKFICINKEGCEAYKLINNFFEIQFGEIVEMEQNLFRCEEEKKNEVVYNQESEICLIDCVNFKNSFITLAEWRNKQINQILEND
jgi:hypothetical protein